MVKAYCLKERKHVEVVDPQYALNKIGKPALTGKCASCGGKVSKLLKASEVPDSLKNKKGKGRHSRKSKKCSKN